MNSDILIRTYSKDSEWLFYCLKSLRKYASGFRRIMVLCRSDSGEVIKPIAVQFGCDFMECEPINKNDYVGQMATKMFYDVFTDADVIFHVDSDMIFSSGYNPLMMQDNQGKIIIGKQEYRQLNIPWKPIVEKLVGFTVEWEYNRIFPSAYPRWLYAATRDHLKQSLGVDLRKYLQDLEVPEFSEINVMGAVAEKFFQDKFAFRDITRDVLPARPCTCYWSWAGLSDELKQKIEFQLK